ncbi:MAG: gamma-glutamyltransferase family protein, partial [Actinomycetia bacterium]|nr:gamma-glutamyltransferase family protein [Actinomycetes bacterium]
AFTPVCVEFPGADQIFHAGPGSVAVPGNLSGLLAAHAAWGRLPLAGVVSPAIQLAFVGSPLEPLQAVVLGLVREIMLLTPECEALIQSNGTLAEPGDVVANPDLAGVLQLIADGEITSFANPFLADRLLGLIQGAGGIMTMADLRNYQPILRKPVLLQRGEAQIALNPPPAFGGAIVADAITHTPELDDSPQAWEWVVKALRNATDQHRAHGSESVSASKGTTHISVTDAEGQVVSLTTSNGSGSGVVIPQTGIHLNNMLGEADLNPAGFHGQVAGTRMSSMMSPCIVQDSHGTVTGLGTGGSERIRSTLSATLLRLIDLGKPLDRAIADPRMHPETDTVQVEPGWPEETLSHLAQNHNLNPWPSANLFFGGVHAVSRHADGSVIAVGDSRRAGAVGIVEP